jgi:hypothetical protein
MRIYAVADIHGKEDRKNRAIALASGSDLAIVCGDMTQFGPAEYAKEFLDEIGEVVKTLALPGNCDEWETTEAIEDSKAENLHNKTLEFMGLTFFGYGGSVPSLSVKTIFENEEERIYADLKNIAQEGSILVTHSPPKGHLDETMHGFNIGSLAILKIIEETKPILNVFGHVHERVGSEKLDDTWLVNCSAGMHGAGCYIDLDVNDKKVVNIEFLE